MTGTITLQNPFLHGVSVAYRGSITPSSPVTISYGSSWRTYLVIGTYIRACGMEIWIPQGVARYKIMALDYLSYTVNTTAGTFTISSTSNASITVIFIGMS